MIRGEINTIRRDERNAKNCHLIPHRLNPTINILEFKILSNANLKIEWMQKITLSFFHNKGSKMIFYRNKSNRISLKSDSIILLNYKLLKFCINVYG